MTIYLTRVYDMSVENIGYALTVALTIGVVFSTGFGVTADKFDKNAICWSPSWPLSPGLWPFRW